MLFILKRYLAHGKMGQQRSMRRNLKFVTVNSSLSIRHCQFVILYSSLSVSSLVPNPRIKFPKIMAKRPAKHQKQTGRGYLIAPFPVVPVFIFCCCLTFLPSLSSTWEIRGPAQVVDADSLIINGRNIRLDGIDAPEWNQECRKKGEKWMAGQSATQALRIMLKDQSVTCFDTRQQSHHRVVARCWLNGVDLGKILVSNGWAFDSPRHSKGYYAHDEAFAREKHLGIWTGSCDPPWVWRHSKRNATQ